MAAQSTVATPTFPLAGATYLPSLGPGARISGCLSWRRGYLALEARQYVRLTRAVEPGTGRGWKPPLFRLFQHV